MIKIISLKDLIYIIPDLMNLFLSGFIFVSVYNCLNTRTNDMSLTIIWSLFISYLIKLFYSLIHIILLKNTLINSNIKILVYSATGFFLFTKIIL